MYYNVQYTYLYLLHTHPLVRLGLKQTSHETMPPAAITKIRGLTRGKSVLSFRPKFFHLRRPAPNRILPCRIICLHATRRPRQSSVGKSRANYIRRLENIKLGGTRVSVAAPDRRTDGRLSHVQTFWPNPTPIIASVAV